MSFGLSKMWPRRSNELRKAALWVVGKGRVLGDDAGGRSSMASWIRCLRMRPLSGPNSQFHATIVIIQKPSRPM
eukprot:8004605-Pyramimonas_sp.AAC.1